MKALTRYLYLACHLSGIALGCFALSQAALGIAFAADGSDSSTIWEARP